MRAAPATRYEKANAGQCCVDQRDDERGRRGLAVSCTPNRIGRSLPYDGNQRLVGALSIAGYGAHPHGAQSLTASIQCCIWRLLSGWDGGEQVGNAVNLQLSTALGRTTLEQTACSTTHAIERAASSPLNQPHPIDPANLSVRGPLMLAERVVAVQVGLTNTITAKTVNAPAWNSPVGTLLRFT